MIKDHNSVIKLLTPRIKEVATFGQKCPYRKQVRRKRTYWQVLVHMKNGEFYLKSKELVYFTTRAFQITVLRFIKINDSFPERFSFIYAQLNQAFISKLHSVAILSKDINI